ncbi:hypothetical protein [Salegentibacter mishustinae]|uniref:hypothetical protein n=1 Tax=Salegentibacter mishustinae TaxID=270918 RepID=UPI002490A2CB|nr:hypothetical protein [Salegentibacter mishustinae]
MSFKKTVVFSFLFLTFFFYGQTQQGGRDYPEEDENKIWSRVIDYLAAELTYQYILEFEKIKPLNEEEKASFDNYREKLANNTIDRPFAPNSLKEFMDEGFTKTYGNLTQELYDLKNIEPKTADKLFQKTDSLLVVVKSNLQSSTVYEKIKYKVYSELKENEDKLDSSPVALEEVSNDESISESFLPKWFFKALSGILFVSTVFYFFLYRHNRDKARGLEKSLEKSSTAVEHTSRGGHHSDRKWNYGKDSQIKTQSFTESEKRKRKPKDENYNSRRVDIDTSNKTETRSDYKSKEKEKESFVEAADSKDIKSETHAPLSKKVTYDHLSDNTLYAGKPTNDGWFKDAERLQGDNHIYELKLSNESEAEFALLELSKYMETEVINSPDDYLYRVCINENSNQEYRNEIITTKSGVARKVDGKWKVNEEDKATIKFQ